jgi:hypothetical protein
MPSNGCAILCDLRSIIVQPKELRTSLEYLCVYEAANMLVFSRSFFDGTARWNGVTVRYRSSGCMWVVSSKHLLYDYLFEEELPDQDT